MPSRQQEKHIYRVQFHSDDQLYDLYVSEIHNSSIFGFVELVDFHFGEKAQVVVDPTEDRLRNEFGNVRRVFIPLHHILRIDEVKKEGTPKIIKTDGKTFTPIPFPVPTNKS